MVYITQPNDTPERVAARFYGKWELMHLLYAANPDQYGAEVFPAGIVLQIPDPLSSPVNHVIQANDTYRSLSAHYYNNTEHFAYLIRHQNKGLILQDNIGAEITIPALVKKAELERLCTLREAAV